MPPKELTKSPKSELDYPEPPANHPAKKVATVAISSASLSYVVCGGGSMLALLQMGASLTTMKIILWGGGFAAVALTLVGLAAGAISVARTNREGDTKIASVSRAALYLSVGSVLASMTYVTLGFVILMLLEQKGAP